jgi:hypothetical protein
VSITFSQVLDGYIIKFITDRAPPLGGLDNVPPAMLKIAASCADPGREIVEVVEADMDEPGRTISVGRRRGMLVFGRGCGFFSQLFFFFFFFFFLQLEKNKKNNNNNKNPPPHLELSSLMYPSAPVSGSGMPGYGRSGAPSPK